MSTIGIMILFGLMVPVFNRIGNIFLGLQSQEIKNMQKEFINEHLGRAIIGVIISLVPAFFYWAWVISQL